MRGSRPSAIWRDWDLWKKHIRDYLACVETKPTHPLRLSLSSLTMKLSRRVWMSLQWILGVWRSAYLCLTFMHFWSSHTLLKGQRRSCSRFIQQHVWPFQLFLKGKRLQHCDTCWNTVCKYGHKTERHTSWHETSVSRQTRWTRTEPRTILWAAEAQTHTPHTHTYRCWRPTCRSFVQECTLWFLRLASTPRSERQNTDQNSFSVTGEPWGREICSHEGWELHQHIMISFCLSKERLLL